MYRDSHEVLLIRIVSVSVEHRAPRRRAAFSEGDHRADRLALVHQNVAAAPRTAERRALRARKSPGTGPPDRRRNGGISGTQGRAVGGARGSSDDLMHEGESTG